MLNKFLIKILKTKFREIIQYFSMGIELLPILREFSNLDESIKTHYRVKLLKNKWEKRKNHINGIESF
ncbi:hypothetical protein N207_02040 [Helicobacter pylori UM114]|uniref:Uncharacterized protein n=1 Tax=Helicobacter pylori UM114 TaxID=1355531 RepID=T0G528_HELPX|nr:hypothetical protein N207_02040 [Helicobacter pylori UM114]